MFVKGKELYIQLDKPIYYNAGDQMLLTNCNVDNDKQLYILGFV